MILANLFQEAGIARILAGGTDVLVQNRLGLVEPDLVIGFAAETDDVIDNESSLEATRDQVEKLHGLYCELALPAR